MARTLEMTLPEHWLPPLASGEFGGLDDEELDQLGQFIDKHGIPTVLDVGQQNFIQHNHHAACYGVPACVCRDVVLLIS